MSEEQKVEQAIQDMEKSVAKLSHFTQKVNHLEKLMLEIKVFSKTGLSESMKAEARKEVSSFWAEEVSRMRDMLNKTNPDAFYYAGVVNEVLKVLKEQDIIEKTDLTSIIQTTIECASYSRWRQKMEDGRTERYQQKVGR